VRRYLGRISNAGKVSAANSAQIKTLPAKRVDPRRFNVVFLPELLLLKVGLSTVVLSRPFIKQLALLPTIFRVG